MNDRRIHSARPVGTYVIVDGWVLERDVVDRVPRWRALCRYDGTSGLLRRKLDAASPSSGEEPAQGGGGGDV